MSRIVAQIVIDGANGSFDKRYTYAVPTHLIDKARVGCRVTVPFGNGNSKKQGMIFSVLESEATPRTKEIISVTDNSPILNDEMIKMCEWLKDNVFCSYFDAIRTMIPAGLNYRLTDYYSVNEKFASTSLLSETECEIFNYILQNGETSRKRIQQSFNNAEDILLSLTHKEAVIRNLIPKRRMNDLTRRWVKIGAKDFSSLKLTARQKEIVETVDSIGHISVKELQYFTGVSSSVINTLVSKGIFEDFEKQDFRLPYVANTKPVSKKIELTDEQNAAYEGIKENVFSNKATTSLLYGVTGSGKTQVFLKLTDDVSNSGKGVIIMVPEIALTPQMINIFTERYGDKIAIFHSAMSLGQRMDEYSRIKQGKALIAIGTRSAVFAPFEDLGLIIIDEEQEHTYKSEKTPRFHARELARFRASYHKCAVCLASATPSIESYIAAQKGKYSLFVLKNRYGKAVLPEVQIVDMKKELNDGNSSNISRQLAFSVEEALNNGKQAIILLNRRGHNTYVSCRDCGWVAECNNCSLSMTYHSKNGRLMCHYCGASIPIPNECPQCKSRFFSYSGCGTQKLEEELSVLFPQAKILRLDADSTISRDSYSNKLGAFSKGEYNILLGTQMVAKGLDFPNVTVVGVIGADKALTNDDYRGFERTFSLLTQVIGRAGRSDSAGVAVIQTNDTENNIITLAKTQDYNAFFEEEILNRKLMIYPPYCDICVVFAQSTDSSLAKQAINEIYGNIKQKVESDDFKDIKLIILGPSAATVPKINNRYRYRMIIKVKNNRRFREMLRDAVNINQKRDVSVGIDINPETII